MSVKLEDAGLRRTDSIRQIATFRVATVYDKNTIEQAAQRILQSKVRRLPVIDKKKNLLGIVTSLDVLSAVAHGESTDSRIGKIMVKNVVTCQVKDSLEAALQKMKVSRRGGLPIINENKVVGIISERDFVKNFDRVHFKTSVEKIMVKKPIALKISSTAYDAFKTIATARLRRFPVLEGKKVAGLVTAHDVLQKLAQGGFDVGALKIPVASIMRTVVVKAEKDADVSEAIKIMNAADVGGAVVTDKNDNLHGILTDRDILQLVD